MAERTLISGGTGLIGSRLIERLNVAELAVRNLGRGTRPSTDPSVEYIHWDGTHLPNNALRGCHHVVHLSGEPVFRGRLNAVRRDRILSSRVDSTRSIVEAMAVLEPEQRPTTFVCASAVGFYGDRGEEMLDESKPAGTGFLADVCQKWEAAARTADELGVRVVSLRIGIVLSRTGGALPMMALPFRFGIGGRIGDGAQWVPWIHLDDLAELIVAILRDREIRGVVNGVAPNPVRNTELTTALAQTLRRPSMVRVPGFVLKTLLDELSGELLGSRRCTPKAALDRGFEFAHSEIETALESELS